MSTDAFAPVSPANPFDPAAQAARRAAASEAAREAEIAAIKEKGFATYVKEMEEEKLKKMREEILRSMGLTEDALAKMEPEARATVEKLVSQEIQKRLAATSAVNGEGKGTAQAPTQDTLMTLAQGSGMGLGKAADAAATGAALLSLQEVEPARTGPVDDVKDSRERGRGLPV